MKFKGLSRAITREQKLADDYSYLRRNREQKIHEYSARRMLDLAKGLGITTSFNPDLARRNPLIYAKTIYPQPEIN